MRFFQRSLIALGLAAMLPTLMLAATGVFFVLRAERDRVQEETFDQGEEVMARVDAILNSDAVVLRTLSTSLFFELREWRGFYMRAEQLLKEQNHWATVILIDLRSGKQIFDLRRPFDSPPAPPPFAIEELERLAAGRRTVIGGIRKNGMGDEALIHLFQPVDREGALSHVIVLALRPQRFQDLLLAQTSSHPVAAIVDRDGAFIARTLDYPKRVGTPATEFVRRAIREGNQGFYRGSTYEGLENYTAFYTSPLSGWSAHIAVASSVIDTPAFWSVITAGLAGLSGVALAAVLVWLVLRDMAERRHTEELLRQTQKMEAVGQLTGGIAHDFNNLLTAVIGNLDLIRTRAADDARLQRLADRAMEAARLGAKLASRLLAFSRTQRLTLAPVDLQPLLKGMMALLRQSVGPTVTITIDVAPDARMVLSDANQLELAILNIAVNARDAMPRGGTLEIRSRRANAEDTRTLPPRAYVELSLRDTGVGMSEDVRARAMEPFYTTKPVGQGTGLGLAQVYGIVRESGGLVQIESAVSRGTTVKLLLPLALLDPMDLALTNDDSSPTVPGVGAGRTIKILVVDDDSKVRRFMSDALSELGYRVLDAAEGAAALDLLGKERVDLLIVDFAMPGRNGAEIARAAQSRQPGLPVMIVTGYADSAAIEAALGNARLLRKPFDLAELARAVVESLRPI